MIDEDLLRVDGVRLPGVKDFSISPKQLTRNAEQNMDGDLSLVYIGEFPVIDCTFRDGLTLAQVQQIMSLLSPIIFDLTFFDIQNNDLTTAKYYRTDYSVSLLERQRGLFKSFTVQFIPYKKRAS
jgi:hypothetical protein